MPSEIAKRMGRPRLTPGIGPSGLVTVRIPDEQRQEMEDAAARARLSLSAFIRQSGLWCTAPDVLREMLPQGPRGARTQRLSGSDERPR